MLLTQLITQVTDAVIGLVAVMVFIMVYVICSTKDNVIMDVTFINVSGNNV